MINLADFNVMVEIKDNNIAFGQVVRQSSDSITVNCIDINSIMPFYRQYDFPEAFEEGILSVSGKANDILLESISLMKQYNAIKTTLDTLEDDEDFVFSSLITKKNEIMKKLSTIQCEFEDVLKEEKYRQHRETIAKKEEEIEKYMFRLASLVGLAKQYKSEYDNYSGFRFGKKYKQLKSELDEVLDKATTYMGFIHDAEEKIKYCYEDMGMDYELQYASMPKYHPMSADSCASLFDIFRGFENDYPITNIEK